MRFNFDQYRNHRGGYAYLVRWFIYAVILVSLILLIRYKMLSSTRVMTHEQEGVEVFINE
jgi:heme exporter protein D